jgi:hypothetical protein
MVFRYRIVPVSYSAPHVIDAPIVGTVNSSLDEQVDQLAAATQSLLGSGGSGSAPNATPNNAAAATPAKTAAPASGGNMLAKIQALLDAIGASVPQFLSRYRNLNLVFEGARTSASLPGWFKTVKEGFATFRTASDKTAAAGALAEIVSAADSLKTETRLAFQKAPTHTP